MAFKDMFTYIERFFEWFAKFIKGLTTFDFSMVTETAAYSRTLFIFRIIFYVVIFLGVAVGIYHLFFKYNKIVMVKKLKGSAVIDTYKDRGRIMKDKAGKEKLILFKTRKTCPVPSYRYTTKMGKLDYYELYLDERGNLYPVNDEPIIDQVLSEVKSDKNIDWHILGSWRLEEMKLAEEKYRKQSFMTKHMPEIMVFLAMMAAVAIVWVTMKAINVGMFEIGQSLNELAKAISSLK
jgi:disulfide bond formation protein DsbB